MNNEILKGKWNQIKGKVKSKWAKLTDDDIQRINGDFDKLVGAIQEKYGKAYEEVKKEIENL